MTQTESVLGQKSLAATPEPGERPEAATRWAVSFTQEAQLIADELARYNKTPGSGGHFPVALRIRGPLNLSALEAALNVVTERHSGLTATYHATDAYDDRDRRMMLSLFARTRMFVPGLFEQRMHPDARVTIQHRRLGPVNENDLARVAEEESSAPLQTDVAPVMRASVTSFDRANHLLVLTMSHLVVDGWSAGIVRREVIDLYFAGVSGQPCAIPPVTSHSGEFAVMEHRRFRRGELADDAEYWQRQWEYAHDAIIRHDELPCALRMSGPYQWSTEAVKRSLSAAESSVIRQLLRHHRITPHAFFRTALILLLHRYTGRRRIAVWANFANRHDATLKWMVGSCVHSHILPVDVSQDSTVIELCHDVARRLAEAQCHEAASEAMLPLLGVRHVMSGSTRISFDVWPAIQRRNTDSVIDSILVAGGHRWVDLSVRLRDEGERLVLYGAYNDRRYSATGVLAMLEDLVRLVSDLTAKLGQRVSEATGALLVECT